MSEMPERLIVAVTGTIGSGKSTVCSYLRRLGFVVDDCDEINRQLLDVGELGYQKVIAVFEGIAEKGRPIDKTALANVVFSDPERLLHLQNILHPLIKERLIERMKKDGCYIAEVPLLFETDFYRLFNYKVLIVCDEKIAVERLERRGLTNEMARSRIKRQMPVEEKMQYSDYIIYNNGTEDELYEQVDRFLKEVKLC